MTAPVIDGYEAVADPRNEFPKPEGAAFEGYRYAVANGYTVMVVRAKGLGPADTAGYDEGLWEVNFVRPLPEKDIRRAFGQENEVATEFNELCNDEIEGFPLYSSADEAKVAELVAAVAAAPTYTPAEPEDGVEFADLDALFGALFGGEK